MAKKTSKKSNSKKPIKNRKLIITLSIIGLLIVSLVGGVATYGLTMLGKINKVDLNENNLGIDKYYIYLFFSNITNNSKNLFHVAKSSQRPLKKSLWF